jgi:hypothetical protein
MRCGQQSVQCKAMSADPVVSVPCRQHIICGALHAVHFNEYQPTCSSCSSVAPHPSAASCPIGAACQWQHRQATASRAAHGFARQRPGAAQAVGSHTRHWPACAVVAEVATWAADGQPAYLAGALPAAAGASARHQPLAFRAADHGLRVSRGEYLCAPLAAHTRGDGAVFAGVGGAGFLAAAARLFGQLVDVQAAPLLCNARGCAEHSTDTWSGWCSKVCSLAAGGDVKRLVADVAVVKRYAKLARPSVHKLQQH